MNLIKKIPKFLLTLAVLLPTSLALAFTDVSPSNPHNEAIEYLEQKGAIQGYSDGTFRPDSPINRAEFLKILLEAKSPGTALAQNLANCFPDVTNAWYAPYICDAKSQGIVNGYPDGNFRPANNINLAEALKMVLETYEVEVNTSAYSIWYEPYFWAAESNGWLNNINRDINHLVTRGEMAQLIWGLENINPHPYPLPTQWETGSNACNQNSFTMAFIILESADSKTEPEKQEVLTAVMENFERGFSTATYGLAKINTEGPFIIQKTPSMMDEFGLPVETEIVQTFYQSQPNRYDFISYYTTFETSSTSQWHNTVKNTVQGIGMSTSNDASANYGSTGRLRGINFMKTINALSMEYPVSPVNGLLHETAHQWCCYAGDAYSGNGTGNLEIRTDSAHYYPGLNAPEFSNGDALFAQQWKSNADGTYSRVYYNDNRVLHYHPFTLYFMGLLPKEAYDEAHTIFNAGPAPYFNNEKALPYKQISVNDIIDVLGERTCEN